MNRTKDPATFIGIFGTTALVLGAVVTTGGLEGFFAMVHVGSAVITVGGSIFSSFTAFSMGQVLGTAKTVKRVLSQRRFDPVETIRIIVTIGQKAKREGLVAIEQALGDVDDPLIEHGAQLAADGLSGDDIEVVLRSELEAYLDRQEEGREVVSYLSTVAPAFGMIGTLIGLVLMLGNLEDPSAVGSGMATALLTTLYGALLANVAFAPLAKKLEQRSREEAFLGEIAVQGCAMIGHGVDFRLIQDRLLSQIADQKRSHFDQPKGTPAEQPASARQAA